MTEAGQLVTEPQSRTISSHNHNAPGGTVMSPLNTNTARIAAIVGVAGAVLLGANAATAAPQAVQATAVSAPIVKTIGAAPIKTIGGSFVANRTTLGTFRLPPGTWQIATSAAFNRALPATATKTRPQLVLRYGLINTKGGGTSAGTIAGVDISPAQGAVLTGSTVQTVTVPAPAPITVWVYGSGVNDDGSDCASGQITVAAQITATKIG